MKDPEFIELLNLYLDHEISAKDSARLETEVLNNPQRRRTYQEYCRMQKACVVLSQEAAVGAETADRKVVAFESTASPSWGFGAYAAGLCAAAACVTLVFVARDRFTPSLAVAPQVSTAAALTQPPIVEQDSSAAPAISRTVSVPRKQGELKPVFAAYSSLNEGNARANSLSNARDARFEWLSNVQISALSHAPTEDLVFRAKSGSLLDISAFPDRRAMEDKVETAAFQFQR